MGAGGQRSAIGLGLGLGLVLVLVLGLGGCFQDEGPEQASSSSAATMTATSEPTSASDSASMTDGATTEPASTTGDTTGDTTSDTTTGGPSQVRTCPNVAELVLCYEFEEGWTDGYLHDSSATAHHGLMDVVTRVPGHAGSAAALTGDSSVYASYDQQVFQRLNDGFTIAAWINPAAGSLSGTRGLIERDGHVILAINGLGDTYKVLCDSAQAGFPLNSETQLAPDTWNHVACVYDGSSYSLWINGAMESQYSASIAVLSDDPLYLGNDGPATGPSTAMVGMIDEIQLWEIPLKDAALCTAAGIESCSVG